MRLSTVWPGKTIIMPPILLDKKRWCIFRQIIRRQRFEGVSCRALLALMDDNDGMREPPVTILYTRFILPKKDEKIMNVPLSCWSR